MNRTQTFVVVGAGLAAAKAVEELRAAGFAGGVVVYGDERHRPYERPPLSKGYLKGGDELGSVFVHPPEWYRDNGVDLRLGAPVLEVDTEGRLVRTADGAQRYDRLLIATGATPRRLAAADSSGAPVAYLRAIEDSDRIKAAFGEGQRIVVLGGGWIGLEVAAAAREAGTEVTVVEVLELPLLRVLGPEVARVFAGLHRERGVDLRTGTRVASVERDGDRAAVRLDDGSVLAADLVVVGVGVRPNSDLAEAGGIGVDNGVVVDEFLRASRPDVFAAGDVANAYHPVLGRRLRVEHWDNAIEQGRVAARNMLGGELGYDRLPYFFTDQYDLGMEYVGGVGPEGYDEVVLRGDTEGRVFTAFWLRGRRVLAGMHANDWDAADRVRAIVGTEVDQSRLRDGSVPLEDVAG
ncbi:NAD(P)/FAD-dependent oxidoreductase [Actinorugispora endophytica]|uniref:NAD/ferredoxin-dependent reductase-like protein n=1 Tax=Actinorugispora endophytica TaxID=1605990 RepID=A0A4R6UVI6_9ACTN|nr:FAD-dependent oxidoreductase [Actinorugispora endophytica]TDQ50276.1 NAD/ferredoxin-dependent reductase-like protein [Actinorugispora endophytica]